MGQEGLHRFVICISDDISITQSIDPTYLGQAIDVVGDAMTLDEMAAAWSNTTGRKCSAISVPLETLEQFWSQGVPLFRFIGEGGCDVDVTVTSEEPALLSFTEWLERADIAKAN
ncbi:hypothetical protein ACQ4M3_24190 [Leptolyngbya sp. AN03gr2]|uniref:hypothetical protein n=1 Tax=unclassified Leptolyngbya TaxID=2650499 RepID=UPI003D316C77